MESVDSTSSARPLMVRVHFDKWRVSLKNRPSGWSGLASMSPLGFETRNVEPSSVLIVLSLIQRTSSQPRAALHQAAVGEHGGRGDVARSVAGQHRDHAGNFLASSFPSSAA